MGQPVTVRLDLPDGGTRYFNGPVNRSAYTGFDGAMAIYQVTPGTLDLVPDPHRRLSYFSGTNGPGHHQG